MTLFVRQVVTTWLNDRLGQSGNGAIRVVFNRPRDVAAARPIYLARSLFFQHQLCPDRVRFVDPGLIV